MGTYPQFSKTSLLFVFALLRKERAFFLNKLLEKWSDVRGKLVISRRIVQFVGHISLNFRKEVKVL